jgi:ubiquinone/menaquinone biosynthesis C-methylase UbiE
VKRVHNRVHTLHPGGDAMTAVALSEIATTSHPVGLYDQDALNQTVLALPALATAYDTVGAYDQDAINGFSDEILTRLLDLVNPGQVSHILDAMAGNGNLTARLYDYCDRRGLVPPDVTMLEFSRVQCELATAQLAATPTKVVWGNILTMEDYAHNTVVPDRQFDRVMLKSANHEIPLRQQLAMYKSIWRVLKPQGLFVNLGFLFDDGEERDQFREIARCKDSLAGMHSAVENRHFLTRDELYTRLQQAGFVDIRCGLQVHYTISSRVVTDAYFAGHQADALHAEFQAQQAKALHLRRNGRIHFQGDSSIMVLPGEITLARRPL